MNREDLTPAAMAWPHSEVIETVLVQTDDDGQRRLVVRQTLQAMARALGLREGDLAAYGFAPDPGATIRFSPASIQRKADRIDYGVGDVADGGVAV